MNLGFFGQWVVVLGVLSFTQYAHALEFCIQDFNAYGPAYAPDRNERTDGLVDYLGFEGECPVMHFQEVWVENHDGRLTGGLLDTFPDLTRIRADEYRKDKDKTGLTQYYQGKVLQKGSFKFKENKSGVFDWMRGLFGVEKGVGWALVDLAGDDRPILFLNLHLHPASEKIRVAQILETAKWLNDTHSEKWPIVMTGDFNANPGSYEWKLITSVMKFRDAYREFYPNPNEAPDLCTYCESTNPMVWGDGDRWFDYVFVKDSLEPNPQGELAAFRVKGAEVNPKEHAGRLLSDHYGLRAMLDVSYAAITDEDFYSEELHYERNKIEYEEEVSVLEHLEALSRESLLVARSFNAYRESLRKPLPLASSGIYFSKIRKPAFENFSRFPFEL